MAVKLIFFFFNNHGGDWAILTTAYLIKHNFHKLVNLASRCMTIQLCIRVKLGMCIFRVLC